MAKLLIKFPHGLGDVVQFTVVLQHLRKYRPDWEIDVRCGRGKHTALLGQCRRVYHDQEPDPSGPFDTVLELGWYENYCRYRDRPNSKITNCLAEVFGLDWDASLCRYQVRVSSEALHRAMLYVLSLGAQLGESKRYKVVLVHYEGNTSPSKKNFLHHQAKAICEHAIACGRIPVVLDWDGRSPLPDGKRIHRPPVGRGDLWGGFGSGDAETIAALITLAEAYIGIDSGPGKIASATDTPTLIYWKGHHPIQFHDPADNTLHLVPGDHRRVAPCCDDPRIADWFERHYAYRLYSGDHGFVAEAQRWLGEVLGCEATVPAHVSFVLPNGIGDVMWALHKIRAVAGAKVSSAELQVEGSPSNPKPVTRNAEEGRPIDIILSGDPRREIDQRAVPFLKHFPWVREVSVLDLPVLVNKQEPTDSRGRYVYESDGLRGPYHYLVPNGPLERGRLLEDWLPEFPVDWSVIDTFDWTGTERGARLGEALRPFAAFYLGPETGNVDEGHNRGFLWEPKHWVELGLAVRERGLNIVLVGAPYDYSYWQRYVEEGVRQAGMQWTNLIGKLEIGETLALLRKAQFFVSYQCGLGIVSHYLGQRVAMWWRPDGNSCHPKHLVSFDERMAWSWTNPALRDRYIPLIYRRETPGDLVRALDKRGWFDRE